MTGVCATCRWWGERDDDEVHTGMLHPGDHLADEGCRPNADPEVHTCGSPLLRFWERPSSDTGAAICDGSQYLAELYTAAGFGCVNHEIKEAGGAE